MKQPYYFGIRHLSPAGAFHLREFLNEHQPKLVLIEGPSDLNDRMDAVTQPETVPPIAILAYTKEVPVRTILYPFAVYSPEYQAILWCHENGVNCKFIDLPSDVFLAVRDLLSSENPEEDGKDKIYQLLDEKAGEDGHETFWERVLEHCADAESYHQGANAFGMSLRSLTEGLGDDWAETVVREAYMSRQIHQAIALGLKPEEIAVVTGAYHVEGLKHAKPMTNEEVKGLPRTAVNATLMPYSYYRLSSRYGAGNRAPAYYALLWEALNKGEPGWTAFSYLSRIAGYLRSQGSPVSSADVIEGVRLAYELAEINGYHIPALRDLRDGAVTCLGNGSLAAISLAVADTEIGTAIGSLPEGASCTSIQDDFYRGLKELKLEKYRDLTAQDLKLDLREKRSVKSEKSAFLDLHRSFFLHRLKVLKISFANFQPVNQENATWAEHWVLRWTPEAEIELVESSLKGDTLLQAVSFQMKEILEGQGNIKAIAQVIEESFCCGMPGAIKYAAAKLQEASVDAASVDELADCVQHLSVIVQYGSIRCLEDEELHPILKQLFYRSCLLLPVSGICDNGGSNAVIKAMNQINTASLLHDFLNGEAWLDALWETASRDDINTRISGFAAAILLERGKMAEEALSKEVSRRLSRGVPVDLGAGWFEGLSMKNHYAMIARMSLWKSLDDYLDTLDDEEFKRALVFLRRAFADFSAIEKDEIAENMGEIWGLNGQQVSETLNTVLEEQQGQELTEALEDFDFDF